MSSKIKSRAPFGRSLVVGGLACAAIVGLATESRSDTVCAGLFKPGSGAHAAWIGRPWNDFVAKWAELEKQGLRMSDFETYTENGQRLYSGIFEPGGGP